MDIHQAKAALIEKAVNGYVAGSPTYFDCQLVVHRYVKALYKHEISVRRNTGDMRVDAAALLKRLADIEDLHKHTVTAIDIDVAVAASSIRDEQVASYIMPDGSYYGSTKAFDTSAD